MWLGAMMWAKDNWPKLVAAVLVPVILGVAIAWIAKEEREVVRHEQGLRDDGHKKAKLEMQQEVLKNVDKADAAGSDPDPGNIGRVRSKYDACSRDPAACE